MTQQITERIKNRRFVPKQIDLCNWEDVKPLFDNLFDREIQSVVDLEQFILDRDELDAALQEENARIQLATSVNTIDEKAKDRFTKFQNEIISNTSSLSDKLDTMILQNSFLKQLDPDRYGQLIKVSKHHQKLFAEKNIPIMIKDAQLGEKYSSVSGGMSAVFDGKERNLTQISNYVKETDRSVREKAWRTMAECRSCYCDEINELYSNMIDVRHQMAVNAGYDNFRDFRHQQYNRFDYSPEDCFKFHQTIQDYAVPVWLDRVKIRRAKLGIENLKPWDMRVDPDGNKPLRPFKSTEELEGQCAKVLDRIYPDLGDNLRLLQQYGNLDLATRKNKATVGFNMPLFETGVSFIFMNTTGTHNDFMVLLHEGGHAIETKACSNDPIVMYRNTPSEWGECASQSMELLGLDHLDVLYDSPETRTRCIIEKFEEVLLSLITTARNDAFQQWVYTHPEHTLNDRADKWMELGDRFPIGSDNKGLESFQQTGWQIIPHFFIVPFYYIEYGIAQMAALQVYKKSHEEGPSFIGKWLDAMKLGYSKTIPELYETAGLKFKFHGPFAKDLIQYLSDELNNLELGTLNP